MEITIYRCIGEEQLRLSLAFEVDQYVWHKKDQLLEVIYRSRSIGDAFSYVKKRQPLFYASLSRSEPIWMYDQIIDLVEKVYEICEGRAFLKEEITECLKEMDIRMNDVVLSQILQILYLQGRLIIQPAVELDRAVVNWRCNRCHAGVSHLYGSQCATCEQKCVMCEHCYLLGKSRSCAPLFLFSKLLHSRQYKDIKLSALHYTPWQQRVIEEIEQFWISQEKRLLLWAVTGAGKTEVMVPIIQSALRNRKRILWVTPRKDVVLELLPRLRQIFYKERILGLYGGSKEIWAKENLVIATAHQSLRYYQYFDFVVIDEVDAFPLYRNQMLETGIRRAMTSTAKVVYLTATPPVEWRSSIQHQNVLQVTVLPMRYHGHPLPIPKIVYEWSIWRKIRKERRILAIESFIEQMMQSQSQAMIFVPRIRDVKAVCMWLQKHFSHLGMRISGVHGQISSRENTIQDFREQKIDIMVTTTVLERGVTVSNVHVLVLAADHSVYDRATLIQIAGRVGRDSKYPSGEIWFLTSQKTEAQVQAICECQHLNNLAKKEIFNSEEAYIQ